MKLGRILLAAALFFGAANAGEFVDYKQLTKKLKKEAKANGLFATTAEVKAALKDKSWAVVDVRPMEEWSTAHIKGAQRVGRQTPEKALAGIVLDDEDNFTKKNIIVVCASGARASIEAQAFKQMGFDSVKIYGMYNWFNDCEPFMNKYSKKKKYVDSKGKKHKYGAFKAPHCYK